MTYMWNNEAPRKFHSWQFSLNVGSTEVVGPTVICVGGEEEEDEEAETAPVYPVTDITQVHTFWHF